MPWKLQKRQHERERERMLPVSHPVHARLMDVEEQQPWSHPALPWSLLQLREPRS